MDHAHVVTIDGPLTADAIVDAHLAALAAGKPLRIVHEGTASAVALRTAARFGATLVAAPTPPPAPSPPPAPPSPPSILDEGSPGLPWDLTTPAPEPTAFIELPEEEFESMPWNVVDNVLLPAGRHTRAAAPRPTLTPDWGLPWPRPGAPMDGIAKADPKLWRAPERIQAIREDLERAGAPSFGMTKPEGSAWLKRLSEFGSP